MKSSLLYVNNMGLYIRKTNDDITISQFLYTIDSSLLYGDTVFVNEHPDTDETLIYYAHNSHDTYQQNNALDYDFEVGCDEQGRPYLDFQFTNFGGIGGVVYVETDYGKKSKGHGRGKPLAYYELHDGDANINMETQNITWMYISDIELGKKYRLYINFIQYGDCNYSRRYIRRYRHLFGGNMPSDWLVHLNVRLGFNWRGNEQLVNFKNYKRISYNIDKEYEL